jgi:hypothetical protein
MGKQHAKGCTVLMRGYGLDQISQAGALFAVRLAQWRVWFLCGRQERFLGLDPKRASDGLKHSCQYGTIRRLNLRAFGSRLLSGM